MIKLSPQSYTMWRYHNLFWYFLQMHNESIVSQSRLHLINYCFVSWIGRAAHRACVASFRAAIAASSPAASAASATSVTSSSSSSRAASTEGDTPSSSYCVEGQQFKSQYIEWLVMDGTSSADDIRSAIDFVCAARPPSLSLYFTCIRATQASFATNKGTVPCAVIYNIQANNNTINLRNIVY
jgi:hypothetical protein